MLIYLTQVGLPDFAKRPLLENLRARGLELQFSRLRLSWYYGIVAENVRFGRAEEPLGPGLTAARVQLRLDCQALTRLQFQVYSLLLRRGRLVWAVAETNEAPRQLTMDNIQAELRFLPDDEWALDHFTADFAGAKLQLSGTVANASAVREWRLLKVEQALPAGTWRHRLREFADTLERIRFSAPPGLRLDVRGDARDLAPTSASPSPVHAGWWYRSCGARRQTSPQIEAAIADFAGRAREARLTLEDLSGGPFSITNGGVFGSLLSTPILNPPQSAILGMQPSRNVRSPRTARW